MVIMRSAAIFVAAMVPATSFAQAPVVTPGQWEMAVTINTVDMPNAPPMVAKMMQGRTSTIRHCITPEEAARGPQEAMKSDKSCSFTHYSAAGGKLSSEMVCTQSRGTLTATSSGTYTATSFAATGKSVMSGSNPMTMTTTTSGHRIGDCK